MNLSLKPLYIWAGGKTRLLRHYAGNIPPYGQFHAYVEPFFGGGAIFCDVLNSQQAPANLYINDVNSEIIGIYTALKEDPASFLVHTQNLAVAFNSCKKEDRKKHYYALRKTYWSLPQGSATTAATLYVLMRLSFNGVWQSCEAAKGKFATPAGLLDKDLTLDLNQLQQWATVMKRVHLSSKGYEKIKLPKKRSLIYCDPPYRGSFTSYGQSFDDDAQLKLIHWCDEMTHRGHCVLLANRNIGDEFFETNLPAYCKTTHFDVTYTAGRRKKTENGFEAKPAREFLTIFDVSNKVL